MIWWILQVLFCWFVLARLSYKWSRMWGLGLAMMVVGLVPLMGLTICFSLFLYAFFNYRNGGKFVEKVIKTILFVRDDK